MHGSAPGGFLSAQPGALYGPFIASSLCCSCVTPGAAGNFSITVRKVVACE
jgi:hypothetical protein